MVYWKMPNESDIYTIQTAEWQELDELNLDHEGFVIFPFSSQANGYLLKGKSEKLNSITTILPKINANQNAIFKPDKTEKLGYLNLINKAVSEIKTSQLQKVVLARTNFKNLETEIDIMSFFQTICQSYPKAFVYLLKINDEYWIGATPELLIKKENQWYETYALAGTKSKNNFGQKEILEQQFVKDYIVDLLKTNGANEITISELTEMNTGNLIHLINKIEFKMDKVKQIPMLLHPTPAVCGLPLNESQLFIKQNEGFDRSFYTGFLGPISSNLNYTLFVNLRCAKLNANQITFYAGAGITGDSIAEDEFFETERKMNTLRDLLN